nr:uncharacterized protein LOC112020296 [Quercus suber]POF15586.1 hypothetical protein CFP56_48780 [Quercus suber]
MRDFLEKMPLPDKLSELYDNLLSRCTCDDRENQRLASTALKLLATARRPLSVLELAWAVAVATSDDGITTVAALTRLIDHQRILILIHPFIGRIDLDNVKKPQLRLVHQSVKEYVSTNRMVHQLTLSDSTIRTANVETLVDQSIDSPETLILETCMRYILLKDVDQIPIFTDVQLAIEELPQAVDLFTDRDEVVRYDPYCTWEVWEENMIRYDPVERGLGELFVYASCHWLEHYGAITIEPFPDLASVEEICQARSTRLHNWTQQNCRPGCVLKPRFDFDSTLYDPIGITSLYGSEAMLRHMLRCCDFKSDRYLPQSALAATDQILRGGEFSRLSILWSEGEIGQQLRNLEFFRLVLRNWSDLAARHRNWDPVFDLVDLVANTMVQEHWANELLCMAAKAGCMPIIRRLLTRARHDDKLSAELLRTTRRQEQAPPPSRSIHQSIGEAVLGDYVDVVDLLLTHEGIESHLQCVNSRHENVLHLAAGKCNPAMIHLLVPRTRRLWHQTDHEGHSPVVRMIMSSADRVRRLKAVETLFLHADSVEDRHSIDEQQEALRTAARLGDVDMCRLLVEAIKVSPLSAMVCARDGHMVLREQTPENEETGPAILQLLIRNTD